MFRADGAVLCTAKAESGQVLKHKRQAKRSLKSRLQHSAVHGDTEEYWGYSSVYRDTGLGLLHIVT